MAATAGVGVVSFETVPFDNKEVGNIRQQLLDRQLPTRDQGIGYGTYDAAKNFGMTSLGEYSAMSAVNYGDISAMDKTSIQNDPIKSIERRLYAVRPGKVVVSNKPSEKANALIITDDGVTITSSMMANGFSVTNTGVTIQGEAYFSAKGTSIKKGEFTENPKSSHEYTYNDEVVFIPEALQGTVDELMPAGAQDILGKSIPFVTDIAPGPIPHVHTISMKHRHRLEPAYLYRFPKSVDVIKGAKGALESFLSDGGGFGGAAKLVGSLQ